jgi:hypothetical protein
LRKIKVKASSNHLPSLLSSILFLLAGLFLTGVALFMGLAALTSLLTGSGIPAQQTIFLATFGFEALVLFAVTFFTLQKYRGVSAADQQVSLRFAPGWMGALIVGAFACILLGYLITRMGTVDWLVLPVLTVPAIVLPLAVLLALGTRHLPFGTRWQTWTILGLSMTLGPVLLFILEIVLGLAGLVGVLVYIMTQPELVAQLQGISQRLLIIGPQSEEAIRLLSPYLTRPAVIGGLLLYVAVLVPAIEEMLKPIGVWLFARKLHSPAQGFSLGALSGAGYALIETVGVSGQQSGEWASLLFTRIGTGLLHITTSALMGVAIVYAMRERRYARLLATYLLAVLLHGLWNALATMFTFSTLAEFLEQPGSLSTLQPVWLVAMSTLAAVLFALLVVAGRRFENILPETVAPEHLADEIESREPL